ncbi:unnamed protein product [Gulo gulo]|uniref:Uncharacterized protein n=1 Tax=Gulo gulo TaxID=48420 RepID=A0A9X9M5W0_GULGU|nr:unnamed protein product [Gulo gulo]
MRVIQIRICLESARQTNLDHYQKTEGSISLGPEEGPGKARRLDCEKQR